MANQKLPVLSRDLHLRLDEHLQARLAETAKRQGLKISTLARVILLRHIGEYQQRSSGIPSWLR
jgi:antitoxin component of RelBE/YafQ-DinJ toxin-antitoxin module